MEKKEKETLSLVAEIVRAEHVITTTAVIEKMKEQGIKKASLHAFKFLSRLAELRVIYGQYRDERDNVWDYVPGSERARENRRFNGRFIPIEWISFLEEDDDTSMSKFLEEALKEEGRKLGNWSL